MTIIGDQDATERDTGELAAERLASRSALDWAFTLFADPRMLLVELDEHHRIVRCNRGYASAHGREPEELVQARPQDLSSIPLTASPAYLYTAWEEWSCNDGAHRLVRWLRLWTFEDQAGKSYLKLGTCDEHEPDDPDEYIDSQVQFRAFLDSTPDAIITINDRGEIVSVNPATERLFGYERSELHGRNVSMLMPSPDREQHDEYLRRYLETGTPRIIGIGRDITARRKDGGTFPARLSVSEFEAHGRKYFTGMLHDITDRVRAEEKQRNMLTEHAHASRVVALGEMASSIAHEINQPLTAIVSYADASRRLVENDKHDSGTLSNALRQISEQGQRAGEIIRRLREFVHKKTPQRSSVDLNELIKSAVALTTHDADRHGIILEFDLEPDSFPVIVDRLQIEQVILNLVRNSIEAMTEHGTRRGHIKIVSRGNDDYFKVSISDNGPGIPPASLTDIFNPFYTSKEKGTGLGLSISQSIAEAHGGDLNLERNGKSGTTFTLTIPAGHHE